MSATIGPRSGVTIQQLSWVDNSRSRHWIFASCRDLFRTTECGNGAHYGLQSIGIAFGTRLRFEASNEIFNFSPFGHVRDLEGQLGRKFEYQFRHLSHLFHSWVSRFSNRSYCYAMNDSHRRSSVSSSCIAAHSMMVLLRNPLEASVLGLLVQRKVVVTSRRSLFLFSLVALQKHLQSF
jgi:hypothetical protein